MEGPTELLGRWLSENESRVPGHHACISTMDDANHNLKVTLNRFMTVSRDRVANDVYPWQLHKLDNVGTRPWFARPGQDAVAPSAESVSRGIVGTRLKGAGKGKEEVNMNRIKTGGFPRLSRCITPQHSRIRRRSRRSPCRHFPLGRARSR